MKVCAEADTLFDGLWVGETEVTSTVTSGDGWSYNASTDTLTLTDYYYDGDGHPYTKTKNAGIYYKGESPLNIVVEKTQYYSYIGGYEYNFVGIYAEGGVVLTGEGRLIIYGNSGGIIGDAYGDGDDGGIARLALDRSRGSGCCGGMRCSILRYQKEEKRRHTDGQHG